MTRGSNARDRIMEFSEYLKLSRAASSQLRAVLTMAFYTGMRKGEIMNLKWSDIDRKKDMIRLGAGDTKEAKPKVIPINKHVKKVLESLPWAIGHDFVFLYRGEPIQDVRNSFEGLCDRAGVLHGRSTKGGLTFHDIRTTVKTNMLRAGIDKAIRDTLLGHSLAGMDAFYIKPSEEDLQKAMEKYTRWIDKQLFSANVDQNVDQR
jgi:integrase